VLGPGDISVGHAAALRDAAAAAADAAVSIAASKRDGPSAYFASRRAAECYRDLIRQTIHPTPYILSPKP
jgi:hypothetical protein